MMDHNERTGKTPDGSYRYVRPESREVLYRDASVEPAQDAAQLPRCYTPPKKEEREKKEKSAAPAGRGFFARAACMCLVCAVLGGAVGGGFTAVYFSRQTDRVSIDQPLQGNNDDGDTVSGQNKVSTISHAADSDADMSLSELYAMACGQVVGVTTEVTRQNFWGMTTSAAVNGSGFILSEAGYILTNYHVIEAADLHNYQVKIMLHDGTAYAAKIIGTRPDNDIAVLQIEAPGLVPAVLGNSDAIQVGDAVHAVGNPMGELEFTMTNGSVSALDRVITTSESIAPINMFQIDAAVNTGNSGGPLYNDAGEVIGVVTAKYSESGVEGLGFAIPINDAAEIAGNLIAHEDAGKAYLGIVNPKTMSTSAAMYYNSVPGAYVSGVVLGSAADRAGIQAGDVICRLGSIEINSADNLQTALRGYHAGDEAEIAVCRDGEELVLNVTMDEQPDSAETDESQNMIPGGEEENLYVYNYRNAVNW